MKKILALVLALVLVLTATAALAAGSKTSSDTQNAEVAPATTTEETTPAKKTTTPYWSTETTKTTPVTLKILPTPTESVQAIIDKLADGPAALPEDLQSKIEGFNTVSEVVAAQFEGDTASVTTDLEATIEFKSVIPDGEVKVVTATFGNNAGYEVFDGKGVDGKVKVVISNDFVKNVANEVFALIVLSK